MTSTTRRRAALIRRVIAAIGAAGLLGAAIQAQAHVERDRIALEARVAAVRDAIQRAAPDAPSDRPLAQWFNWGNWNNWNNWPNWGNWGNWLNKR